MYKRQTFIQNGVWAIISRISKFVNSIKFRLTASYLVMLVLSLTVVNFLVISYMGDTLLEDVYKRQLLDEFKNLPVNAVWDYICLKKGVPVGTDWIDDLKKYEQDVMLKRK